MNLSKRIIDALVLVFAMPVICMAYTATLDFESLGGNLGPGVNEVVANDTITIDGVLFDVPGPNAQSPPLGEPIIITGGGGGVNGDAPFATKSLALFTNGPDGMTITFPDPIIKLKFEHGQGAVTTPATYHVTATGLTPFNFTTQRFVPGTFDIAFPNLVTSVHFEFVSGSANLLNIDNLTYSTPEPSSIALLVIGAGAKCCGLTLGLVC